MTRKIFGKVVWVGRTASTVFGLALVMALLFGVASTALGANGGSFILGKATNAATKATGLIGKVAAGEALVVKNPSGGSALGLSVGDPLADPASKTVAPMKVDSQAVVENLNADKLDGKSNTDFYAQGSRVADSDLLDGKDSTRFVGASTNTYENRITITGAANSFRTGTASCDSGDKVLSGGFFGLDEQSYIQASYPSGEGWYIQYWDGGSTATNLTVYAFCADV